MVARKHSKIYFSVHESIQDDFFFLKFLLLRGDDGANVAKSSNCESDDLEEDVKKVLAFPIEDIIASTKEKENCESQFLWKNPV